MNLLIDDIDHIVEKRIPIEFNTDFRISIMFEILMQDRNISNEMKMLEAIKLYYPKLEEVTDVQKAMEDIIWFYCLGKEEKKTGQKKEKITTRKQIYSYEFDDALIYDAFLNQYRINLQRIDYLHWWEFKAMFDGLKDDNQFVKIMGYRAVDLSQIKDKEEKKHYKKLQKLYALPDMRTEEQKEADLGALLW